MSMVYVKVDNKYINIAGRDLEVVVTTNEEHNTDCYEEDWYYNQTHVNIYAGDEVIWSQVTAEEGTYVKEPFDITEGVVEQATVAVKNLIAKMGIHVYDLGIRTSQMRENQKRENQRKVGN